MIAIHTQGLLLQTHHLHHLDVHYCCLKRTDCSAFCCNCSLKTSVPPWGVGNCPKKYDIRPNKGGPNGCSHHWSRQRSQRTTPNRQFLLSNLAPMRLRVAKLVLNASAGQKRGKIGPYLRKFKRELNTLAAPSMDAYCPLWESKYKR